MKVLMNQANSGEIIRYVNSISQRGEIGPIFDTFNNTLQAQDQSCPEPDYKPLNVIQNPESFNFIVCGFYIYIIRGLNREIPTTEQIMAGYEFQNDDFRVSINDVNDKKLIL